MNPDWPHQVRGVTDTIAAIEAGETAVCLSSPTGGGKSRMATTLIEWGLSRGVKAALYTTRKLLTDQLIGTLGSHGVRFGVRASGYDSWTDDGADVQICSSPTENHRVFKARDKSMLEDAEARKRFKLFDAGLVLVDELHMQKAATVERIIREHMEQGAVIVGLTATPVGVSHITNKLIVAGTKAELRSYDPPALVPALTFSCPEIDTSKIKRDSSTLEFSQAQLRKVYTTHIYGHVVSEFEKLNPDRKPTLLFAPGVDESRQFVRWFEEHGIKAAHIDGDDIEVDGERFKSKPEKREEVLKRFADGEITVICNRWVLREGIDLPFVSHLILAVPVGSLVAYTQIVGRVLRAHPSLSSVVIQDHGGNWYRHPSPNEDIPWEKFFELPERVVSDWHEQQQRQRIREKKENAFPCEHCGKVLKTMSRPCPACGKLTRGKARMVIQHDGKLKAMKGDPIKVPKTYTRSDVLKRWDRAFFACKNSDKTFSQARGLFIHRCIEERIGYFEPPMDLPRMPRDSFDWHKKIADVPAERLITQSEYERRLEPVA